MPTIVEKRKFVCTDVKDNHNKFWDVSLFDNDDVLTEWGRVGYGNSSQQKTFSGAGKSFMESKIREKEKKGYRELKTVDCVESDDSSAKSLANNDLKKIVKAQIKFTSSIVADLVDYLIKTNAHNIYNATGGKITYDASAGTFKTPRGIVTVDNITEARRLLTEIGDYVQKGNYSSAKFIRSLEDYMMLIPMNVGMGKFKPETIFPDQNSVVSQNSLLDSLEASFNQVITAKPADDGKKAPEPPKLFDVTLDIVEDGKEIDRITKFFKSTKHNMHACSHLKIKKVYGVTIAHMSDKYEKKGKTVGGVMELWHGTKAGNILSILKSGFIIPPSNASYCTGRMFGNGVYFSDQSTKSLNYAYGYWGGGRDNNCFMFLNDVAMGKYYVPHGPTQSRPPAGYDSYFAQASKSGVMNNEMIVFDTAQINPRFLIEFCE